MPTPTDPKADSAIRQMAADPAVVACARQLLLDSIKHRYSYNFQWLGVPIIQYPQDVMAMQEIIWRVKPRAIVETGIAHGGSLVFSASMLELIGGDGIVVGIDVDLRAHNREVIEAHPLSRRIVTIDGSSIDPAIVARVKAAIGDRAPVLVCLDSNHTHSHVLSELQMYSPLVTRGSYLVVFDTVIEHLPREAIHDRPWGPGDNPMTAVHEFLRENQRFVIDDDVHQKLLLSVAPDGYLKCVS